MDLKFENFRAEHVETLAGYYGKRHDRTCDSTIMDNFLWGGYYHIRFCERDGKAVLWIMNIDGKDYAALPVCGLEDLPHYFKELEQYFNEELHLPLEIFLADEEAVEYLRLPEDRYSVEELPDARDYIYSAESLKVLSGKKVGPTSLAQASSDPISSTWIRAPVPGVSAAASPVTPRSLLAS